MTKHYELTEEYKAIRKRIKELDSKIKEEGGWISASKALRTEWDKLTFQLATIKTEYWIKELDDSNKYVHICS